MHLPCSRSAVVKLIHDFTNDARWCRYVPQQMKGLEGVKISMAVCGWRHSVLVDSEGRLLATGWGKYGQLGTGNTENKSVPVHVPMPNKQKVRTPVEAGP